MEAQKLFEFQKAKPSFIICRLDDWWQELLGN